MRAFCFTQFCVASSAGRIVFGNGRPAWSRTRGTPTEHSLGPSAPWPYGPPRVMKMAPGGPQEVLIVVVATTADELRTPAGTAADIECRTFRNRRPRGESSARCSSATVSPTATPGPSGGDGVGGAALEAIWLGQSTISRQPFARVGSTNSRVRTAFSAATVRAASRIFRVAEIVSRAIKS